MAPMTAPESIPPKAAAGTGTPNFASSPVMTLAIANCEPIEISMCPTRITIVIPIATIKVAALSTSNASRLRAL